MRARANIWKYVLAGGACAVAGYTALSGGIGKDLAYSLIGLGSVTCVLLGVRLHRPADRLGWCLVALAALCFLLGDGVDAIYRLTLHTDVPFPSAADACYLAGYPFLFVGVLRLARNPNHTAQREDYADAAIVAVGALAVSWQFLMSSYVHETSMGTLGAVVLLAYPIMDIALLFVVARALVFGDAQQPFQRILALALLVLFGADFAYSLVTLHGASPTGNPASGSSLDTAFLAVYVLLGVAALHPSIAEPVPVAPKPVPNIYRRETNGRRRIPVVAFAGFIPPCILLVCSRFGMAVNVPVMAGLCIAVFALIYLRMMWLIARITGQTNEIEAHARALEASHQQRDALEADLRHLAFHDELTGLANRALLHDRVEHALAAAPRDGSSVALCFGDLDGFKTVNDTLGHHVGDSVLVRASRLLSSIVRPGDTVARLGGDEFAVLMVDVPRPETAVDFAHRIVSVLQDAPDFEGNQVGLSISVGVAYGEPGKTTEQLLSEADSAMYEAKETGKNRVEVFRSSMRSRMLERLDLTNGFRWALGRSEFFLQYQPIVSLSDNGLQGFEALVRWNHPSLGEVEPLRFIPIAEETGFIVPLGRWVLVEACEQLGAWNETSNQNLTLSVNLSRRQLISPHLTDEVRTVLGLSGIDPQRLMLEVTESVLMEDPERATMALSELRDLGIRIAVDDFGTGYSSLSHLQRFPVDVLKIDKSFIDPLVRRDPGSLALVTAIIGLAQSLGLDVIAEGIEHESQLRHLVDLGCDQGQGFLMHRPLDPTAAAELVADRAGSAALR
ncbi:MAG: putative bifunctional diguanylate cyclase/phosphodiesterase [Acidimicrobiales bacterium]